MQEKKEFFQGLLDGIGPEYATSMKKWIAAAQPGEDRVLACSHIAADRRKSKTGTAIPTNNLEFGGGECAYFHQVILLCSECNSVAEETGEDPEPSTLVKLEKYN